MINKLVLGNFSGELVLALLRGDQPTRAFIVFPTLRTIDISKLRVAHIVAECPPQVFVATLPSPIARIIFELAKKELALEKENQHLKMKICFDEAVLELPVGAV